MQKHRDSNEYLHHNDLQVVLVDNVSIINVDWRKGNGHIVTSFVPNLIVILLHPSVDPFPQCMGAV